MTHDVEGIVRVVVGYNKIPNKDGQQICEVTYELMPLELYFLQRLFNIDPNDKDYGIRDLIDCYEINESQAKELQKYVINGEINIEKYDFMLQCFSQE